MARALRPRAWGRTVIACCAVLVALLATTGRAPDEVAPGHGAHPAGDHMVPIAADAYVPIAPELPRNDWTVTASDTSPDTAPGAVLDGDPATCWHSDPAVADAHRLTLDLHTVTTVSALRYLPRQDGSADGDIGHYRVQLSTDGRHWGSAVATGTWAGDDTEKAAEFTAASARYVRLTMLSDTTSGATAAVAELTLLGAPETDPPATLLLSRAHWSAAASDEEIASTGDVASNVLDNDPYTVWRSTLTPSPTPYPHWLTIDLGVAQQVSGLTYLPPEGGGLGTIGQYAISLSTDDLAWSAPVAMGAWADDGSLKSAYFAPATARYVRLTALGEAGKRGEEAAAAEVHLLRPLDPSQAGRWSPVIGFPIVPVSAVLLPHDRLLTFSGATADSFTSTGAGVTQAAILDLTTGVVSQRTISNTDHEMFCPGIAVLADGRVLVSGGSDSAKTSIYDPATDTWSAGPDMNIPRGYQSDVTLSDGEVFTLGGSWSGGEGGKNGEVYTPGGTWRLLPRIQASVMQTHDPAGVFRADNHGWFFAVSGGQVFHAGPSARMHWFSTTGNGAVRSAGVRGTSPDAMNGDAVMYDAGKILTLGGSTAYDGRAATRAAYLVDISGGTATAPVVTRLPDMAYARSFANSVVLPNGQVVVIGGQQLAAPFSDRTAILQPELWTPSTGRFTKLASMAVPRDYHSVAVLLPDGRVFSGGGGLCGACLTNHPDGQILTPPYLLKADGTARQRPKITSAPPVLAPGSLLTVQATPTVTSFALIRTGAATHSVDTDQRRVALTPVSAVDGTYQLQLPADSGTLVPGNWLLFALDAHGVPSIGQPVVVQ